MVELSWFGILQVLGALALFIYGMKVMSEGVQRIASIQLRDALNRVTQNKISTFLTGFFTTAALQSSSATTVMTVSFVNAGILSLTAAAGIIIGANVGSAVTIWIVTILGFEFNLFTFCLPLIALAAPFIFIKHGKYRHWAETFIGFSIILIAIQFLTSVVPDIQKQQDVISSISRLGNHGFWSIILFLTIGFIFSALIQSSVASMALTISLCLNGWLPFDIAAFTILGANIGTTLSTEIVSWVGNNEAKKAARIHVAFNVLMAIFFLPFLPLLLDAIAWITVYIFKSGNPFLDRWAMPTGLAIFYTLFHLIGAAIFLPLLSWLIRVAGSTVKPKQADKEETRFIDLGSNTAELSLPIALQEIIQQCQRIKMLNALLNKVIHLSSTSEFQEYMHQAQDSLKSIHQNQKATGRYLIGLVEDKSSLVTSKQIKALLNINLLIEHVAIHYDQILFLIQEKRRQRIWYGPTQRSVLLHRINDAMVMLKRIIYQLETTRFSRHAWKGLGLDAREHTADDQDYENQLIQELEEGEMKIASVLNYYKMAQHLEGINKALWSIIHELSDDIPDILQKDLHIR
jgi:phosphate:Na+ symporter